LRFLTNSRLRRKIEQANSIIHNKLDIFKKSIIGLESDNGGGNPGMPSSSSTRNLNESQGPSQDSDPSVAEDEVESAVKLSLMIEDQDGKDLWQGLFGLEVCVDLLV
jgi:hypothetical protein